LANNPTNNTDFGKEALENAIRLAEESRSITEELKDQLGIRSRLSEEDKIQLSISRKVQQAAAENNTELRKASRLQTQILKDNKLLADVQRELGIVRKNAGKDDKDIAKDIVKLNEKRLKAEQKYLKNRTQSNANRLATAEEELNKVLKVAGTEADRLAVLIQLEKKQKEVIKLRKDEEIIQGKVTSALGITGAVLDNINKIGFRAFGGIGVNLATFGE
jgi:hypothetical protein